MRISPRAGSPVAVKAGDATIEAFLPRPLPPDPPVALGEADGELVERAHLALGRLDGFAILLPEPKLHPFLAIRREAVLSSHLEGVGAGVTTSDLLRHEDEPATGPDGVAEVAALAAAVASGASRLRSGCTLTADLLRELDAVLRPSGGALRREPTASRSAFVPPPADAVPERLADLELYLRGPGPLLVKLAVALAQVENLQPFSDGSGRLGRALIPLLLYGEGVLQAPLLYPSIAFYRHRDAYQRRLAHLRADGDWEGWVRFVIEAIAVAAEHAVVTTRGILALLATDREGIEPGATQRVHEALVRRPLATVARIASAAALSEGAAHDALTALERLRIVREREPGLFAYTALCDILDEGTVHRPARPS